MRDIMSAVKPLGGSSTPRETSESHTGPVQVCFPSWTLHSEWHGMHSPAWVANSRRSLHSGREVIICIQYLFKECRYDWTLWGSNATVNMTHNGADTLIFIVIHAISCFVKTNPAKNMQSGTHTPPRLYFLQDRHWSGPGPQQPPEEHRGSHTWLSLTIEINRKRNAVLLSTLIPFSSRFQIIHLHSPHLILGLLSLSSISFGRRCERELLPKIRVQFMVSW